MVIERLAVMVIIELKFVFKFKVIIESDAWVLLLHRKLHITQVDVWSVLKNTQLSCKC